MIIKTKFVDIYFTENDLGYIDDLVLYINNNINIITNFFNITDIDNSDKIILIMIILLLFLQEEMELIKLRL